MNSEPNEPNSAGFIALSMNPAKSAKTWLFSFIMSPAKLAELDLRSQLAWVKLGSKTQRAQLFGFCSFGNEPGKLS